MPGLEDNKKSKRISDGNDLFSSRNVHIKQRPSAADFKIPWPWDSLDLIPRRGDENINHYHHYCDRCFLLFLLLLLFFSSSPSSSSLHEVIAFIILKTLSMSSRRGGGEGTQKRTKYNVFRWDEIIVTGKVLGREQ